MAALDAFGTDIVHRCRWALDHNDGRPLDAWSTGERLAVALVLADTDHLTAMGYTPSEAALRVCGGMWDPPSNFSGWIRAIRESLL